MSKQALWIGGAILDLTESEIKNLQTSNFTDLFIWSNLVADTVDPKTSKQFYFQIGTANCLYYEVGETTSDMYWSDNPQVKILLDNIDKLLGDDSTFERAHLMFGGARPCNTFQRFEHFIFPEGSPSTEVPQTQRGSIIHRMFTYLKQNLPDSVVGIQYDNEVTYNLDTNDALSNMLISSSFDYKLSYIPFGDPTDTFWAKSIEKFARHLSGVYIQTYFENNFVDWYNEWNKIVPKDIPNVVYPVLKGKRSDDSDGLCPCDIRKQIDDYNVTFSGAGVWLYDSLRKAQNVNEIVYCNDEGTIQDYAKAVTMS